MYLDKTSTDSRRRAAFPVALVHAFLAVVLLQGLQGTPPREEPDRLNLLDLPPPVEPEIEPPSPPPDMAAQGPVRRAGDPEPEGAASPPNLRAEPTPIVAPEPVVPAPTPPPPLPAAPVAGTGFAPSAGAAPIRGPGTGAGGVGSGRGSGRGGGGTGAGGGGGGGGSGRVFVMARHVRGDFSVSDIPEPLQERGFRGRVGIRFLIDVDGRAKNCRITRSSGNGQMDANVCRALEQRFRFAPARDENGRPVPIAGEDNPYFETDGGADDELRRRRRDW